MDIDINNLPELSTEEKDVFGDFFNDVLRIAKGIYNVERPEQEDSWLTCDIKILEDKLIKNLEYSKNASTVRTRGKSGIDVLNFALMIAARRHIEYEQHWRGDIR